MYMGVFYVKVGVVMGYDVEQVFFGGVKVGDCGYCVYCCWQCWVVNFEVVQDQVYVEVDIFVCVVMYYVQIVWFEDVQGQWCIWVEYGCEGKQWQFDEGKLVGYDLECSDCFMVIQLCYGGYWMLVVFCCILYVFINDGVRDVCV